MPESAAEKFVVSLATHAFHNERTVNGATLPPEVLHAAIDGPDAVTPEAWKQTLRALLPFAEAEADARDGTPVSVRAFCNRAFPRVRAILEA